MHIRRYAIHTLFSSGLFLLGLFISLQAAQAQGAESVATGWERWKKHDYYSLNLQTLGSEVAPSLGWSHLHPLGKRNRFKLGYGLRYTGYFGFDREFHTAPAELVKGGTGPLIAFDEVIEANIDTLRVEHPQIHSFNLTVHLEYSQPIGRQRLDFGLNMDLLGFSVGPPRTGVFQSSERTPSRSAQEAQPTTFNLLGGFENDRGSLNSQFYLRYWLTPHWAIRASYGFYFGEYQTNQVLTFDNDRFRHKAAFVGLGVSWRPFFQDSDVGGPEAVQRN